MKDKDNRQLAIWLYTGAFCIFIQIILGGITRLTGSGLSITEWQPLLGFLPPMNIAAWQHSFEQYQQIAQFKVINSQFILADYQSIFFWEWLHRNWARMLGFIFLIPFIFFVIKKKLTRNLFIQLSILFCLGLLQAIIGWLMVKSGLNDTAVRVDDLRLAVHFIAAVILLCYTLWMAFGLSIIVKPVDSSPIPKNIAGITFALLLLQLFYGALMAGSHAALTAPTWPDINGYLIPPELMHPIPGSANTYLLTIQFIHRLIAYMIFILVLIMYSKTSGWKLNRVLSRFRLLPLILVVIQVVLGIVTLLNSFNPRYRYYALLHQCTGLLLLSSVLLVFYTITIRVPFKKTDHS
ncbi:COX15/CtaA family protein [Pedobacter sp. L105]|uniref:COX15/CtaA family protein n=1 Tax=Pedobacter sp. L105 TaxID=1641871 RepID=UPI00131D2B67|nr:COX15/CtaA family protein [Pedobacter sp. L105]